MMILTVFLPLLVGLAAAGPAEVHPLSAAAISHINMQKSTWTAGRNFPESATVESLRYLFGVPEDFMDHRLPELEDEDLQKNWLGDFWDWLWGNKDDEEDEDLPEHFDAREQWPECAADIGHIRDQGGCGSCWAVAATATMTDRHCIATKGAERFTYSAADLISCCAMLTCGFGCNGGYPSGAWTHWVRHGIVSGDDYNTTQTCKPYPIAPCEHHTDGDRGVCKNSKTPKCTKTCQPGYTDSYKQDHRKGEKAYSVKRKQSSIMKEIMTHGPVEAAFNVFDDFLNYKSGVYQHVSGGLAGGHAVKMIGWGVENGTPYWLLANSWNTNWGENGFFKILRGKNECGIEGGLTAGIPKV